MTPFCIAVPARNEADRLPTLVDALARQDVGPPIRIAVCINNSSDGSLSAVLAAATRAGEKIQLKVVEKDFDLAMAHAGSARRAAMDLAVEVLGAGQGFIISTDADCRPPSDWISSNLRHACPDRIIGGRIELDGEEPDVPNVIRSLRARFDQYWAGVRAIEDEVDPCAWDPPPRHGDHTGASLCLSVSLYQKAGGVPLIPTGEDRALVAAAIAAGGKLVHSVDVWTRASARQSGRAAAGMADDMAIWASSSEGDAPFVPSFDLWRERAAWRRQHRLTKSPGEIISEESRLPPMDCSMRLPLDKVR